MDSSAFVLLRINFSPNSSRILSRSHWPISLQAGTIVWYYLVRVTFSHQDTVCTVNCKYNLFVWVRLLIILCYRGLNDKESRTSFHHIANIGAKNVYRIFAGGNHSWVVIDDIIPIRRKFRAPSPVPDNKQMIIHGAENLGNSRLRQSMNLQASVVSNANNPRQS